MPKKSCCCDVIQPPGEFSCCRPIYQDCVGKKYEFTFTVKVKYPCFKIGDLQYSEALFECDNGSLFNIPGEHESFEINVQYEIKEPAEQLYRLSPYLRCNLARRGGQCTTIPGPAGPIIPCECYTDTYAKCNFSGAELAENCEGICGRTFGQCYQGYILKEPSTGFNQGPFGCNFSIGESNMVNIADSYSIQFIPDPNIPEQNEENYKPRLQPELLTFKYQCTAAFFGCSEFPPCQGQFIFGEPFFQTVDLSAPVNYGAYNGYSILIEMGFGYEHEFICGDNNGIPITQVLSIPFFIGEDSYFGLPYYDGVYVKQTFQRRSLTNDPMDMCVPLSTQIYPYEPNSCFLSCQSSEQKYKDEYTNCNMGFPSAAFGTPGYGLPFPIEYYPVDAKMPLSCGGIAFDLSDAQQQSLQCSYIQIPAKITVLETP